MAFKITNTCQIARSGFWTIPRRIAKEKATFRISTPAVILSTRQGMIPGLVTSEMDQLERLQGVGIPLGDFAMLKNKPLGEEGIRSWMGWDASVPLFLSMRDTTDVRGTKGPVMAREQSEDVVKGRGGRGDDGKDVVSVNTPDSRIMVSCVVVEMYHAQIHTDDYLKFVQSFQPEVYCAPCDEHIDGHGTGRARAAADRTTGWLLRTLEHRPSEGLLFAMIQGGSTEKGRGFHARDVCMVSKGKVDGYMLGGFGRGELYQDRWRCVQSMQEYIPKDIIVGMQGVGSPWDVLEGIDLGVDVFETNWPGEMAAKGKALAFDVDKKDVPFCVDIMQGDSLDVLVPDCTCETCKNVHSVRYLRHLRETHEILGDVLLMVHNIHHYLAFFAACRNALQKEEWMEWKKKWKESYPFDSVWTKGDAVDHVELGTALKRERSFSHE